MARTFYAKYPGKCPDCGEAIEQGAEVMYSADNKVVHAKCGDDLADLKAPATVCVRCNLVKPCECEGTTFVRSVAAPTGESFFADQQAPVRLATLEEETEAKVPRDRYDRPLIVQPDGSRLPYNRASSYGGQIEDTGNISRWQQQQVVRGIAMHPELLNAVPANAKGDPWADLTSNEKKGLTRIADQAQEYAGSNLKSALGTQIHAATEYIDLGDSLEDKLAGFDPVRRALLIERANAYYRIVQDYGFRWTEIETFGVQDELQVAGTMDRLGFVPFWPECRNTVVDNKTSSSLDFAGVGFSVQLATYSRMKRYDIATETRSELEDVNPNKALIIHIGRELHSPVTLASVDIEWGWQKAVLARQILVARREGKGRVAEIDERLLRLDGAGTRDELREMGAEIASWPKPLRDRANERWAVLT